MRNILCKLPEKARPGLKKLIHRNRIRTTNLLERLFGEGQRRSKVIPRFMNERSGLSLMFAVLVDASAEWRGVKVTPAASQELGALRTSSTGQVANRLAAQRRCGSWGGRFSCDKNGARQQRLSTLVWAARMPS